MADYQSKVPLQLQELIQQTQVLRNEVCCKLRELITLTGGGADTLVVLPGTQLLTSGGTASFTTGTHLQGSSYTSVTLNVISLTTGTVTVTDPHGSSNVSHVGLSLNWQGLIGPGLTITVTGDAVALITYLAV